MRSILLLHLSEILLLLQMHLFFAILAISCISAYPRNDYETETSINDFTDKDPKHVSRQELEAEMFSSVIPFGMPYADKSQRVALVNLARMILKPILKSQELRSYTKFLEHSMKQVRDDPNVLDYFKQTVDGVQQIYERTDGKLVTYLLTRLIAQYTNEATARSVTSFWRGLSPALDAYFIKPLRHYVNEHITPSLNVMRHRIDNIIGKDISSNVIARSGRWRDMVDPYVSRLTEISSGLRIMVESTAKFLEEQDEARMNK